MTPSLVWRNDCQCPSTYRDAIVFYFFEKHVRTSLSLACVCLGHCVPSSLNWPGLDSDFHHLLSAFQKLSYVGHPSGNGTIFLFVFPHFLMSTPLAHAMRKVAGWAAAGRCCRPVKVGMDATFFLSRSTNPAAITATTTTAHKTSRVVLVLLLSGWYNWTDARPRQRQPKKLNCAGEKRSFSCYLITGYNMPASLKSRNKTSFSFARQ